MSIALSQCVNEKSLKAMRWCLKIGWKRYLKSHKTHRKLIKMSYGFNPLTSLFFMKFLYNFNFLSIHVNEAILHPRYDLTLLEFAVCKKK
jgi:hypothetical protein